MKVTPLRIPAIDAARGLALLAMAHFHFIFDLEMFRLVEPGTANSFPWKPYARGIATSFLFLVGFSLVLAHGHSASPLSALSTRGFWWRFGKIAGAAIIITIATYFAVPDAFIFFGILHHIAVASLIGLFFVRRPWWLTAVAAILAYMLPIYLGFDALSNLAGWWTGLASTTPRSNDFVPLLPWLSASLAGIAAARLSLDRAWTLRLAQWQFNGRIGRSLRRLGQHSLAFYLLHQPILIGLIYLYVMVAR
jgi:uncharacterized membrane protein